MMNTGKQDFSYDACIFVFHARKLILSVVILNIYSGVLKMDWRPLGNVARSQASILEDTKPHGRISVLPSRSLGRLTEQRQGCRRDLVKSLCIHRHFSALMTVFFPCLSAPLLPTAQPV